GLAVDDGSDANFSRKHECHDALIVAVSDVEWRREPCRGLGIDLISGFIVTSGRKRHLLAGFHLRHARRDLNTRRLRPGWLGVLGTGERDQRYRHKTK